MIICAKCFHDVETKQGEQEHEKLYFDYWESKDPDYADEPKACEMCGRSFEDGQEVFKISIPNI